MSEFDGLIHEINQGIDGKNNGLPMGFDRLNRYVGIRKRIYNLIFGATGSGKSAFIHSGYILNPYDFYISAANTSGIKFKVMLFSMERNKVYTLAKWLSRKIFIDKGILIQVPKLLGWWDTKLTKDEHDLTLMYRDYIDGMTDDIVTIIEGAQNPTVFYKRIAEYAALNGEVEQVSQYHRVYHPKHPNEIVIIIADHMGLIKREKGMATKKEAIDKVSEHFQHARDFYGYTPVAVSQVNRDLSNPIYHKMDSFEPNLDQIKESGRPGEDAECIISLFDPLRYKTTDPGYDAHRFVNLVNGAKGFRSIKILKNTYGEDDVRIGMAFHGPTGIFKELPKVKDMETFDYNTVIEGSYFL